MADNPLVRQFQNFPVPRLDDRTYQDLMDEMRSLIPVYCPEWTNHNPTDPGITVLELVAHMTELLLYRLNRVPVRNLFALLDLLGVQPAPPSAARTSVVLEPGATAHGQVVKAPIQIGAARAGTGEPLVFETERDLLLTSGRLIHAMACSGLETRDVTAAANGKEREPFAPFAGVKEREHYLFLCDGRFLALHEEGMRVHLRFRGRSAHRDLYARWRWQYFDRDSWTDAPLAVGHGHGEVVLDSIPELAQVEVNGHKGPWLRAAPNPADDEPSTIHFDEIEVEVESVEEGILPSAMFLNRSGDPVFAHIDVSRPFYPLGDFPKWENACYIMARELFKAAGTRVELHFVAPQSTAQARPDPSPDLTLRIEYPFQGNRWIPIREITPNPFIQSGDNPYQLEDTSRALRRGGVISFVVPDDLTLRTVQGMEGPWIRIRLTAGEYRAPQTEESRPGEYVPGPLPPTGPLFETLLIRSRSTPAPVKQCLAYSNFAFINLRGEDQPRGTMAAPFPTSELYTSALYLGFDRAFPPGENRIFFKIQSDGEDYREGWEPEIAMQRIRWEMATSRGFVPLPHVEDGTLNLKRDGYLTFHAPQETETVSLFEAPAFWLRARLSEGEYDAGPRIERIGLNMVDVLHVRTQIENRILPSDGQPRQEVKLQYAPVLGNLRVWVRELEPLRARDARETFLSELGPDAVEAKGDELWVRWKEVDHFFRAGPSDRCFRLDPNNGLVEFGDGIHGRIPPPASRAVRIESYWVGGGERGNVGAHALTVLKESNSLVASVDNPIPASGGAAAESLEQAATRGTRRMYAIDRAVRGDDYKHLAHEASRRVARVYCLEPHSSERPLLRPGGRPGGWPGGPRERSRVRIVILPRSTLAPHEQTERLIPSQELIRRVESYLDERRPFNVRLSVRGPRYVPFSVRCSVYLSRQMSSGVEEDIRNRLYTYLHPLVGGDSGQGWPLGQPVRRVGLFQGVAGSPRILSVIDLFMYGRHGDPLDGVLHLGDDQLPYLTGVSVEATMLR